MTNKPMHCEKCGTPHARCKAHTKTGTPCGNWPLEGQRVCRMHGGKTPIALAKAKQAILTATISGELQEHGWEPVTDPVKHYAMTAGEIIAFKELARQHVNQLATWTTQNLITGSQDAAALIVVYERALDRTAKTLADMIRHGIDREALDTAQRRLDYEQAKPVIRIIQRLIDNLGLMPEQQQRVPDALREALEQEGILQ